MAFDFPTSPAVNDTYTSGSVTYRWNGSAWVLVSLAHAPIDSPTFTGDPKAPTPATGDNDTSIATTAFVKAQGYVTGGPYQPLDGDLTALAALAGTNTIYYRSAADTWSAVTISTGLSFSGGALSCTVSIAGLATLASPVFTGDPQAPTPATADNDTSIATTAFVKAQAYAPLASPALTGAPTAPNPAGSENSTVIATTFWVKGLAYATLQDPVFTGDPRAPTPATGDNDTSIATTAFVKAQGYAPLASPTFTGTPMATTQAFTDNSPALATTSFVQSVRKIGTATNDNASAGQIGEYLSAEVAAGSPVSLSSGVVTNVVTLSLTAGDWDVWGWMGTSPAGSTTTSFCIGFISDVSATFGGGPNGGAYFNPVQATLGAGVSIQCPIGQRRFSLASTTNIYMEIYPSFAGGTLAGFGGVYARRAR